MLPAMESTELQNNMKWKNILGVRLPQNSVPSFQLLFGILLAVLFVACVAIVFLLNRLVQLSNTLNEDNNEEESNQPTQTNSLPNNFSNGLTSWSDGIKQGVSRKQPQDR